MLLNFTFENWKSFRDATSFTMLAGKEQRHNPRIPRVAKYPLRALPVAAIYGGNASGKSNFFQALGFAKQLIVNGVQPDAPIPTHPFLLDDACAVQPTRMVFEILADGTVYEFSFAVSHAAVQEERLAKITSNGKIELYKRTKQKFNILSGAKEKDRLEFVAQSTRPNQLFLTTATVLNVSLFQPVYRWFQDTLILIAPDARFIQLEYLANAKHPLGAAVSNMISQLDTGITRLHGEDTQFPLPEAAKTNLSTRLPEGFSGPMLISDPSGNSRRLIVTKRNGELITKQLFACHKKTNGEEALFDMEMESTGTLRAIDLLPAFALLSSARKPPVYVIDELDRSMHTHLTRALLEAYLSACTNTSRSQLLFTTHDVQLMDLNLLRREEMWIAERDAAGASKLFSLGDFKDIRKNEDIRRSYLQGRFGGIPRILSLPGSMMADSASPTNTAQEAE